MFRRAREDDRELLDGMTLAGLRHWNHHETHPEVYAEFANMVRAEAGPEHHLVFVLEEDGEVIGFYELRDRGDDIELLRMFMRSDMIGCGYGRVLWDDAIRQAARSHRRMTIMSDPGSMGFYSAMGATLEGQQEVAPDFVLGAFSYELTPAV